MIKKFGITSWKTLLFLILGTLSLAGEALAGFSTDRIRLTLSASEPVTTIKVSAPAGNPSPALLQTHIVSWTQKDGENVYEPTKDLIVSPPFMRIPSGGTQILRIGLRTPRASASEIAYRIYIQEVTPHSSKPGIEFRLRESIPIFIPPANPLVKATMSLKRDKANLYTLQISNEGNIHLQFISFKITDSKNKTENITGNPIYVLPGQSTGIPFKASTISGNQFQLVAHTDSGDINQLVTLRS